MDLWLWMGLRGSMKPSSRERLSQNIKLLRIYRFLSERYISFVIRIWLLKIYLGWSVFCGWYSVCVQTRNDGRAKAGPGSDHWVTISLQVSSCVWPLIGQWLPIKPSHWLRLPGPHVLAMHNCRTAPDMLELFFSPDVLNYNNCLII